MRVGDDRLGRLVGNGREWNPFLGLTADLLPDVPEVVQVDARRPRIQRNRSSGEMAEGDQVEEGQVLVVLEAVE